MDHQKIYDIEKKVAELKFLERDLIKERDIWRLKSLDKAERSEFIDKTVKNIFVNSFNTTRKDLIINSSPAKFSGRDDDEFMTEVKVEIRYNPTDQGVDYNELAFYVYLKDGFQDAEVQKAEKRIMDQLLEIRTNVEELKESKKSLKNNI